MPKVNVTDAQGLVQATGSGFIAESGGALYCPTGKTLRGPSGLIVGARNTPGAVVDPYTESTTQLWPLGTQLVYGDRTYRYSLMGAGAVTAGKLLQSDIPTGADHQDLAITADVAAGERSISIETAGTNLVLNQYAEGYLWVNDGTGEGQAFKIKSHPAHVHGSDPTAVFTLYDPVVTAITNAGSQVSIVESKYSKAIVAPATTPLTGHIMGVTPIDVAANRYFWAQVAGPCPVLTAGTVVIGDAVCHGISGGTAGSVVPRVADSAAQRVAKSVGRVIVVSASTEYSLIQLEIE